MSFFKRLRGWFNSPEPDFSRRSLLLGLSAAATAALIAPSLPVLEPQYNFEFGRSYSFLRCAVIEAIERRAVEEIMAEEDARFLALVGGG
jgi:hypothetical protein